MSLFSSLHNKLIEFKYQYYGLNIIQEVPRARFQQIIDLYIERGWEMTGEYYPMGSDQSKWFGKLRKGTSTLTCQWNEAVGGSFIGPERVVYGLGQEFGFTPSCAPQAAL